MVTIVTDSTAYLTREEALTFGIQVVPMTYNIGGHMYHETYVDANGPFEKLFLLHSSGCQTSAVSAGAFLSTFEDLLRQGQEVLCITISSRLSGTFSSAIAAANITGREQVRVVDSLSAGGGLCLLVKEACRLAAEGAGLQEIARHIEQLRERVAIAFSVDDMTPLRRSGRLGFVRQSVSTILNFKPLLLCVDGAVISEDIVRGKHAQIKRLIEKIPPSVKRVIVHCLGADVSRAQEVCRALTKRRPDVSPEIRQLGPVLGIHLGLGVVGIAWMDTAN